jgi:hypothetical protein
VSLHCCIEYQAEPQQAQLKIAAEAIPTRIQHSNAGIVVVPTRPGDASYGASSRCCNGAARPPRAS